MVARLPIPAAVARALRQPWPAFVALIDPTVLPDHTKLAKLIRRRRWPPFRGRGRVIQLSPDDIPYYATDRPWRMVHKAREVRCRVGRTWRWEVAVKISSQAQMQQVDGVFRTRADAIAAGIAKRRSIYAEYNARTPEDEPSEPPEELVKTVAEQLAQHGLELRRRPRYSVVCQELGHWYATRGPSIAIRDIDLWKCGEMLGFHTVQQ